MEPRGLAGLKYELDLELEYDRGRGMLLVNRGQVIDKNSVIAIVARRPWSGSMPRCGMIITYSP